MKMQTNKNTLWIMTIGVILLALTLACQAAAPDVIPTMAELPVQVLAVETEQTSLAIQPVILDPTDQEEALVALYKQVNPAVVNITVYQQRRSSAR